MLDPNLLLSKPFRDGNYTVLLYFHIKTRWHYRLSHSYRFVRCCFQSERAHSRSPGINAGLVTFTFFCGCAGVVLTRFIRRRQQLAISCKEKSLVSYSILKKGWIAGSGTLCANIGLIVSTWKYTKTKGSAAGVTAVVFVWLYNGFFWSAKAFEEALQKNDLCFFCIGCLAALCSSRSRQVGLRLSFFITYLGPRSRLRCYRSPCVPVE